MVDTNKQVSASNRGEQQPITLKLQRAESRTVTRQIGHMRVQRYSEAPGLRTRAGTACRSRRGDRRAREQHAVKRFLSNPVSFSVVHTPMPSTPGTVSCCQRPRPAGPHRTTKHLISGAARLLGTHTKSTQQPMPCVEAGMTGLTCSWLQGGQRALPSPGKQHVVPICPTTRRACKAAV